MFIFLFAVFPDKSEGLICFALFEHWADVFLELSSVLCCVTVVMAVTGAHHPFVKRIVVFCVTQLTLHFIASQSGCNLFAQLCLFNSTVVV